MAGWGVFFDAEMYFEPDPFNSQIHITNAKKAEVLAFGLAP